MIEVLSNIQIDRLNEFGITEFIKNTFGYFIVEEIKRLRDTFFCKDRQDNVFALNERAWVGVLNNAIVKAFPENSLTLQEFSIYNSENIHKGRADLLVHWVFNGEHYNLLFEAKHQGEASGKHVFDDMSLTYKKIIEQAMRYYTAEIEKYNSHKTHIIPICFEWIRKTEVLRKAKEYFNSEDISTDFCYLYHDNFQGVWVYGKVQPV